MYSKGVFIILEAQMRFLFIFMLLPLIFVKVQAEECLPKDNPKYIKTLQIYEKIVDATGISRIPPRLVIEPDNAKRKTRIAFFNYHDNYILIEESLYDLLIESFGEQGTDALAMILGHELAHFYKDHKWGFDFGSSYADTETGRNISKNSKTYQRILEREAQADDYGGFYCFLAGFDSYKIAPDVLKSIYVHYKLDENLKGYPSLAERQSIAERSTENLRQILPLFELANNLLVIKKYTLAGRLYEKLAEEYPGREIYNNLGVAYTLAALDSYTEDDEEYVVYPLQYDADSRLSDLGTRGDEGGGGFGIADGYETIEGGEDKTAIRIRKTFLKKAKKAFETAKSLSPDYPVVYTNLACVYDIMNEHDFALIFAKKAEQLSEENSMNYASATVIKAIASYNLGNEEEAYVLIEKAGQINPLLASSNILLVNDDNNFGYAGKECKEKISFSQEKLAGYSEENIDEIFSDVDYTYELPEIDKDLPKVTIHVRQAEKFTAYYIDIPRNPLLLIEATEKYNEKSLKGIAINDSEVLVMDKYGCPTNITNASTFINYHYTGLKIVFKINNKKEVLRWFIYKELSQ